MSWASPRLLRLKAAALGAFKMLKGLVFDLFGTLVAPEDRRDPYRRLIQSLEAAGQRVPRPSALGLMREPLDLRQAWARLAPGLPVDEPLMRSLEADLQAELNSAQAYPDALEALSWARDKGFSFTVCSNLAKPYAKALDRLPELSAPAALSFETGLLKPEAAMFHDACARLGLLPSECAMLGDRLPDDYTGALEAGLMSARLVDRRGVLKNHAVNRSADLLEAVKSLVHPAQRPSRSLI